MATKSVFPGFEKDNPSTLTVDNVTHQFKQDHKGLSKGFIYAYMGLNKAQITHCDRTLRSANMADSTLGPPSDSEARAKSAWDRNDQTVYDARYKLQTSILNGQTLLDCSALFLPDPK